MRGVSRAGPGGQGGSVRRAPALILLPCRPQPSTLCCDPTPGDPRWRRSRRATGATPHARGPGARTNGNWSALTIGFESRLPFACRNPRVDLGGSNRETGDREECRSAKSPDTPRITQAAPVRPAQNVVAARARRRNGGGMARGRWRVPLRCASFHDVPGVCYTAPTGSIHGSGAVPLATAPPRSNSARRGRSR